MDNASDEGRLLGAMFAKAEPSNPVIEVMPIGKQLGYHNRQVLDAVKKLEQARFVVANLPWVRITGPGLLEGERLWKVHLKDARIKVLVEIHRRSEGNIQSAVPIDDFVDILGIPENQKNAFFNRLSEDRLITRVNTLLGIEVRLRAEGKEIAETELRNAPSLISADSPHQKDDGPQISEQQIPRGISLPQAVEACHNAINTYRIHRQQLVAVYTELNDMGVSWQPKCERDSAEGALRIRYGAYDVGGDGKMLGAGIVTDTNPYAPFRNFRLLDPTGNTPLPGTPPFSVQNKMAYFMDETRKAALVLSQLLPQLATVAPALGIDPTPLTQLRHRLAPFPFVPVRSRTMEMSGKFTTADPPATVEGSATVQTDEQSNFTPAAREKAVADDEPYFVGAIVALEHLLQANWRVTHTRDADDGMESGKPPRPPTALKPTSASLDMVHRFSDSERMLIIIIARMTEAGESFSWRDMGKYVGLTEHPSDDVAREMYRLNLAQHVRGDNGVLLAEGRALAQYLRDQVDDNRQRHVVPWWTFTEPDFPFDAPGCVFKKAEWDKVRLLYGIAETAALRKRATINVKRLARLMLIDDAKRDALLSELEAEHLVVDHGNGDASVTPKGTDMAHGYTVARAELLSQGHYFGGLPDPVKISPPQREERQHGATDLPAAGGAIHHIHVKETLGIHECPNEAPLTTPRTKEMTANPSSWSMLTHATKFYPPAKYAIGLLAVGIVVVLILQIARGLNIAIVAGGIPVGIALIMVLIYVGKFAQTAEAGRNKVVRFAAHAFAIVCLTVICAFLVALFTAAAFGVPEHLAHLLFSVPK